MCRVDPAGVKSAVHPGWPLEFLLRSTYLAPSFWKIRTARSVEVREIQPPLIRLSANSVWVVFVPTFRTHAPGQVDVGSRVADPLADLVTVLRGSRDNRVSGPADQPLQSCGDPRRELAQDPDPDSKPLPGACEATCVDFLNRAFPSIAG
jgi:hypothetical protein